jgi:hypothetical protein
MAVAIAGTAATVLAHAVAATVFETAGTAATVYAVDG